MNFLRMIQTEVQAMRTGVQAMRTEVQTIRTDVRTVSKNVETLKENLEETTLSKSATLEGNEQLFYVRSYGLEKTFAPNDGPAVLTPDEYSHVLRLESEQSLVEFICPKLQLLSFGRVVALSQFDGWLETSKKIPRTYLKPDALIIHRAFLDEKENQGSNLRRGKPAHPSLYLGTVLVDFKMENTTFAFGELVNHLKHLFVAAKPYSTKPFLVKGALAYKAGITLVTLSHNVNYKEDISWSAAGSAEKLSSFFAEDNPTALVLNSVLQKKDLILYDAKRCHNRFLGAGGTGSVFHVDCAQHPARRGMALKVVTGQANILRLQTEDQKNQQVALRAGDLIVKATSMISCLETDGAALLMEEVGHKVEEGNLQRGVDALVSLHKSGFCHGDARRQNLLNCLGSFKWCDLQFAHDLSGELADVKKKMISHDITEFLKSFQIKLRSDGIDEDLLDKYIADISAENINALVKKSVVAPDE